MTIAELNQTYRPFYAFCKSVAVTIERQTVNPQVPLLQVLQGGISSYACQKPQMVTRHLAVVVTKKGEA